MSTPEPELSADAMLFDAEESARARRRRLEKIGKWVLPLIVVVLTVLGWDYLCVSRNIPHYILPRPGLVLETLVKDAPILFDALLITLRTTVGALTIAVVGGAGLAILFTQSKYFEMSFYPYAVILQVTPIVSVAPLIFIYVEPINLWLVTISAKTVGMLICAWIVAFFPILSNTTLGLNSADHNLRDLFSIYGANRWQRLRFLQLPSALPYFLGGLRIAGGLALIGSVVAEYVAGTGGVGSGLAFTILEAGYRLNIPRMFAALLLIATTGVIIFMSLSFLSHMLLRKWHESALKREA